MADAPLSRETTLNDIKALLEAQTLNTIGTKAARIADNPVAAYRVVTILSLMLGSLMSVHADNIIPEPDEGDPEPQPGPEFHEEYAFWKRRQTDRNREKLIELLLRMAEQNWNFGG